MGVWTVRLQGAAGAEFPSRTAVLPAKSEGLIYTCEDVQIDASSGCLKRGGLEFHLRQQSFHLLLYLIEQRQRLISKEELIENFWQGAAVTDNAVVQCIKEIRKALGDDPHEPRFIRTIHKHGYRFMMQVLRPLRNRSVPGIGSVLLE